jgi:hypothetical protein
VEVVLVPSVDVDWFILTNGVLAPFLFRTKEFELKDRTDHGIVGDQLEQHFFWRTIAQWE